jgi:hypothetical protein
MVLYIRKFTPRWQTSQLQGKYLSLGIGPNLAFAGALFAAVVLLGANIHKIPEEVALAPHLPYDYKSNYPQKYLRLKSASTSSDYLESILTLSNNSQYILENGEVKIYILCNNDHYDRYTTTYSLDASEYMELGYDPFPRLVNQEKKRLILFR